MTVVDINSDMGESFGPYTMGDDARMLEIVSSANVACGFHAGDPRVMAHTVQAALAKGVDVGAHPGFMDLWGFGRRVIQGDSLQDITDMIIYQIGALQAMAAAYGHRVGHVKTHGALGNMAFVDRDLSDAIVRAIQAVDKDLVLVTSANNETEKAAEHAGMRIAREIFADRGYGDNGLLLPRSAPGAMIHDPVQAAARILRMLEDGAVTSINGKKFPTRIDTICVHGDGPSAVAMAAEVRQRLVAAGVQIKPIRQLGL